MWTKDRIMGCLLALCSAFHPAGTEVSWTDIKILFQMEFIGLTLVNKAIQVTNIQLYNSSSAHCILCSPPTVKTLPPLIPPLPSSTSPTHLSSRIPPCRHWSILSWHWDCWHKSMDSTGSLMFWHTFHCICVLLWPSCSFVVWYSS